MRVEAQPAETEERGEVRIEQLLGMGVRAEQQALGHPLGASGARLMSTLVHRMRRDGIRYGLQTMCEGGGMANATVVELVG